MVSPLFCSLRRPVPVLSREVTCLLALARRDLALVCAVYHLRTLQQTDAPTRPRLDAHCASFIAGFSDMHIHVLGAAPFGHLLAFHLRRFANVPVSLFIKQNAASTAQLHAGKTTIRVETAEETQEDSSILCEPWNPALRALERVVYNRQGSTRLPSNLPLRRHSRPSLLASSDAPINALVVTTKPTSVVSSLRLLQRRISPSSTVVLLHEGMGVYDALIREVFRNPEERPHFILGSSSHAVWKRDTQHVVHHQAGGFTFALAPDFQGRDYEKSQRKEVRYEDRTLRLDDVYSGSGDSSRYRYLRATVEALLRTEQLSSRWLPMAAMQRRLLRQCVIHSIVEPLAALNGCRVGALASQLPAKRIIDSVCREASAIFAAQNASLGLPTLAGESGLNTKTLSSEVLRYCERYAGTRPQMAFHFDTGTLSDVDYLNGYLQTLGVQYNVPTPNISMLYQMVKLRHALLQRGQSMNPAARPTFGQGNWE